MQTDWSLFFGRFHPLIVHIPIGIILFAALLTVISTYKKNVLPDAAINIALLAGALSGTLGVVSGFLLSTDGGYNENILFWHKWAGITITILVLIVWLVRVKLNEIYFLKMRLSNWLLSACILLIAIGAHLGGKMTHGEGYLTRYMPGFLKSIFHTDPKPIQRSLPPLDSVVIFRDIIQPIFNSKCVSCHNAGKIKGDLNLATIEGIQKGGKSGNTIVAGDVEKSELFHRVTMPAGSSKFMPADNRTPLTPVEINFIKMWIASGADFEKNITSLGVDEKTKFLVAAWLGIDEEANKEIKLPAAAPADSIVVRQLKEMKVIVQQLSSESNLLEVSLVMVQNAGSSQINTILQKLAALKDQVYRLNAGNCDLTVKGISIIAGLSRLDKLEIQNNKLTDDDIISLAGMEQLHILNTGQNELTDKSIAVFKKMKELQKINLWQTNITENGIKDLQSGVTGIIVEH